MEGLESESHGLAFWDQGLGLKLFFLFGGIRGFRGSGFECFGR